MTGAQGQVGPQAPQGCVVVLRMAPEIHEHVLDDVLRRRVAEDLERGRMDGRPELVEHLGEGAVVPGDQPGGEEGADGLHGADRTAADPGATPAAARGSPPADAPDEPPHRSPARLSYVAGPLHRITSFSVIRRAAAVTH